MVQILIRCLLLLISIQAIAADYDVVIANGHVIDPEINFDAIRYVGIPRGAISHISKQTLVGNKTIDAKGLVVAPGFIDVHSHTPTLLDQHVNLLDGITTQLDLEAGSFPVSFYGAHFRGGAQLNYGSSVGHFAMRMKVIEGVYPGRKLLCTAH